MAHHAVNSARGDMAIGRQRDMSRQGLYDKVAELVSKEIAKSGTEREILGLLCLGYVRHLIGP